MEIVFLRGVEPHLSGPGHLQSRPEVLQRPNENDHHSRRLALCPKR